MKTYSIPISNFDLEEFNNGDFVRLKIYAISNKVNRNNSEFMLESFDGGIATIKNKPILAYYNPIIGDAEEHNSRMGIDTYGNTYYDYQYDKGERPVGVIPESAEIYTEVIDDKTWIVVDGALIWTEYNRQLVNLLEKQKDKKVSVEVEVYDSYDENGVEKITAWKWLGITILGKFPDGKEVMEGIEGAHLTLKDYAESDKFATFRKRMSYALNGDKMNILSKYGLDGRKKMSLTMNELRSKIDAFLDNFYHIEGEYQYRTYWIKDIIFDESVLIAENSEDGNLYAIYYSIDDDGNVFVDIDNKKKADIKYDYTLTHEKHEVFLSKKEWGTGDSITIDKSSDSVSGEAWSKVNKTELRNTILKAKNYKTLVKSVYLLVEEGWEESPSSKLKYPVMQIKDGKAVYNANGLLSAQQYGEKYDRDIANKAKRLRKKLGLLDNEKREKMSRFIELAKDAGLIFLGSFGGKLAFAKEAIEDEEKETMSVFEIDKEKCMESCDEEKEFSWDELTEKSLKLFEDEDDDMDDDEDDDNDEEIKKEVESLKEELACTKKELEAKCDELKSLKMEKMKEDTDAILSDEDEDVDEETKEELRKMRDEEKFASVEDFVRELSFRKYKKFMEKKSVAKYATFGKKTSPAKLSGKADGLDDI